MTNLSKYPNPTITQLVDKFGEEIAIWNLKTLTYDSSLLNDITKEARSGSLDHYLRSLSANTDFPRYQDSDLIQLYLVETRGNNYIYVELDPIELLQNKSAIALLPTLLDKEFFLQKFSPNLAYPLDDRTLQMQKLKIHSKKSPTKPKSMNYTGRNILLYFLLILILTLVIIYLY